MLTSALILFVAYLVRGIAGFGSGLIAIPLLALQHPLALVVPLVVLLDWLGSLSQGLAHREAVAWPELLPLLPFTLLGVALGLLIFDTVAPAGLNQAFGVFILVFAVYQLLPLPPLRGRRVWSVPAGFFGGLVGTLFGTGGPFYMIYLTLRGLDKLPLRASFAAFFLVDGGIRLGGFLLVGMLDQGALRTLAVWLPPAALGLFIGGRVHVALSPATFRFGISAVLLFSGYRLTMQA